MSNQPIYTSPNWRDPKYISQIVLLVAILIVTAFGYQVNKPAATLSTQSVVNNPLEASTLLCKESSLACVKAENGAPISAYSDAGTTKTFNVDSSTGDVSASGNISVTGVITTNGGYIGITPVPTTYPTPQTKFLGNETVGQYIKCANSNVTDSLTATPVAGATPVGNPYVSLGSVTGDAAFVSGAYSAGTFTLTVGHMAAGTPAANATPAAVEWCYVYTKAP